MLAWYAGQFLLHDGCVTEKSRKQRTSRGYLPGDALGNFMRAGWGVPKFDAHDCPTGVSPDRLRQFIILYCYDPPLKHDSKQARFPTCSKLMDVVWQALRWPSESKNQDRAVTLLSAKRQLRMICRQLGIELKQAPVGRPRGKEKTGNF